MTFRDNRSTIWSLTDRGRRLNLHFFYGPATTEILDAFAVIATEGGLGSARAERAGRQVHEWPPLAEAIERSRVEYARRRVRDAAAGDGGLTHCCATPDQRRYLRLLYDYFNRTRFGGVLPADMPLRLSRRMRSALGHMLPGPDGPAGREVGEIALNVDLMLRGNGAERVDTLLHEMAHAADYLINGERGHGASWRAWARKVGCTPELLYERPIRRRRRRKDPVERVPPLPPAILRLAA